MSNPLNKSILNQVFIETIKRIEKELAMINKDISDYTNPITIDNFEESMNGRLSSENLGKNFTRRAILENQLYKINLFICLHSSLLN